MLQLEVPSIFNEEINSFEIYEYERTQPEHNWTSQACDINFRDMFIWLFTTEDLTWSDYDATFLKPEKEFQ